MQWLWLAWGRCKAWGLLLVGVGLALVGVYATGRRDAKAAEKVEDLKAYRDTRKRMDEIPVDDDPAVLRDWLLHRGQSDGHL